MTTDVRAARQVIDLAGLQRTLDLLVADGFTVLGPTVRDGAVVQGPVRDVEDLPRGWGDVQEPGSYRLRRRNDDALFGFAAGPQSAKPVFFPAESLLWKGRRDGPTFEVDDPAPGNAEGGPPYALLGLRSCDLAAVGIQDHVLTGRSFADADYSSRREGTFVVAVTCSDPGGTCFCASMGTGPRPEQDGGASFDLALTELLDDDGHRFLVEVGTERGADVLRRAGGVAAARGDVEAADRVVEQATSRMGRTLDTDGIKELMYSAVDSPRWDDVATRCLACTSCTAVCPTCFCTTVTDVSDLTGALGRRERVWDSCFSEEYSYIHGGAVRESVRSRYRQWATHKLASWHDQFGSSGCVGCGRCITWCPAGIDLTAEVAALRSDRAVGSASTPQVQEGPPR